MTLGERAEQLMATETNSFINTAADSLMGPRQPQPPRPRREGGSRRAQAVTGRGSGCLRVPP